jgi:tetratricopeptide (TPR) repeat protein
MNAVVWAKLLAMAGVGGAALWWLARRAVAGRGLSSILLASFGLRLVIGLGAFLIALYEWPVFTSLQLGSGFWLFGIDARVYHHFAVQLAKAWALGTELPTFELPVEYFAVVASVYRLMGGAHPLYGVVFNGWLAALSALVAYWLARRLMDPRLSLWAAAIVGFWPSSLLWSSQLLKDSLSWVLILSTLTLVVALLQAAQEEVRRSAAWWISRAGGLLALVVLLTRLRFYVGTMVSLACLLTVLPAGLYALARRQPRRGLVWLATAAAVVATTLLARTLDVTAMLAPPHPDRAHIRLAADYRQAGDLRRASEELALAIAAKPAAREYYLWLGQLAVEREDWEQAISAYRGYLQQAPAADGPALRRVLAMLYINLGNHNVRYVHNTLAAIAAYEEALRWDPTSVDAMTNLGIALSHGHQFPAAFASLQQAWAAPPPEARDLIRPVIAHVYAEQGNYLWTTQPQMSTESYYQALAFNPTLRVVYAKLGCLLVEQEQMAQAVAFGDAAFAFGQFAIPEDELQEFGRLLTRIFREHALLACQAGDVLTALHAFERVAASDPHEALSYYGLAARSLAANQHFDAADDLARHALALARPGRERAATRLMMGGVSFHEGRAALREGRRADTLEDFTKSVRRDPTFVDGRRQLAGLLAEQGKWSRLRDAVAGSGAAFEAAGDEPMHIAAAMDRPGIELPEPDCLRGAEDDAATALAAAPDWLARPRAPARPLRPTAKIPPLDQNPDDALSAARRLGPGTWLPAFSPDHAANAEALETLRRRLTSLDEAALLTASETTPAALGSMRDNFVSSGGYSLMDTWAKISSPLGLITYLPRALAIGIMAPFPTQWFDTKGSTGVMRVFAGFETALVYLLLPGMLVGTVQMLRSRRVERVFLIAFVWIMLGTFALVVANLGSLFRLRLQGLLPLLIVGVAGWPAARAAMARALAALRAWSGPRAIPVEAAPVEAAHE